MILISIYDYLGGTSHVSVIYMRYDMAVVEVTEKIRSNGDGKCAVATPGGRRRKKDKNQLFTSCTTSYIKRTVHTSPITNDKHALVSIF